MSEDQLAPPPPGGGGTNKTFLYAAAGFGIPLVIMFIIAMVTIVPRLGRPGQPIDVKATETANSAVALTAERIAQVTKMASTSTVKPATKAPVPAATNTPFQSATPKAGAKATETPPVQRSTAMGTNQPSGGGNGGVSGTFTAPTPEAPITHAGVAGDTGGLLLVAVGFGLLLVFVGARRLRSA